MHMPQLALPGPENGTLTPDVSTFLVGHQYRAGMIFRCKIYETPINIKEPG